MTDATKLKDNWNLLFVRALQDFPVLIQKSQKPDVKQKKEIALTELVERWSVLSGKRAEKTQIIKRIANMKAKIKEKADLKRTGNKLIQLSEWEKVIADLMHSEENPSVCQLPGATSAGVLLPDVSCAGQKCVLSPGSAGFLQSDIPSTSQYSVKHPNPKSVRKRLQGETEETENLTTAELQRLVLLEQLQVLRLKKKKLLESVSYVDLLPEGTADPEFHPHD